jgi:hypothetical protein
LPLTFIAALHSRLQWQQKILSSTRQFMQICRRATLFAPNLNGAAAGVAAVGAAFLIEVLILGWQVTQYRRATGAHISAQNLALPSSARLAALSGDSCQVAPGTSSDSAQETIGSSPW